MAEQAPTPIKEEERVQDGWYAEADKMRLEQLPAFLEKLTTAYKHDYGTICHAIAAAAIAAAWSVERSPVGGITGFQAGAVMWGFITHWMKEYEGKPVRLVDFSTMLYPQYADKFAQTISEETHFFLMKEAKRLIQEVEGQPISAAVLEHWKRVAHGEVPFGYRVDA